MNVRQLAIPLPFTVAVQKTARHKLADATYFTVVDIAIPVYDGKEAPVAAHFDSFGAPEGRDHVRTTGDGFFRPVFFQPIEFNPVRRLPPIFMSEEKFVTKTAQVDGQDFRLFPKDIGFMAADYRKGEVAEFDADHVFNYDKPALNAKITAVQEAACDLALIDGYLYQRSPEPYYKVKGPSESEDEPSVSVVVAGQSKDRSVAYEFALSNFDEASDYAERMFGQALKNADAADVLIPHAFSLDRTRDAVLELLDKALDEHAPYLTSADLATMMAWGHLRDAVLRAERSNDPTTLDAVFEIHAERYTAAPEAKPRAAFYLKQARERWSLRPVHSFSERTAGLK
ncbi:hypothetical protein [Rhizobium sp. MHM7A]|uniref:hypothetical protein n=1 Tax=Rhizobium sp. MHM7A TaxID=2583233 RepID=UPI0011072142|nr:hypothetical protein [Rhizobium sp. MHM7A]TLX16327.1 hypothetical protein FFR93_03075 [Rhizobium sp. MHM7A]